MGRRLFIVVVLLLGLPAVVCAQPEESAEAELAAPATEQQRIISLVARLKKLIEQGKHPTKALGLAKELAPLLDGPMRPGETQLLQAYELTVTAAYNLRKFAVAIPWAIRALAVGESIYGPDHEALADPLFNLATLYRLQRKHDLAGPLFERCIKIQEDRHGNGHPDLANSLMSLAQVRESQRQRDAAIDLYRRSIETLERAFGRETPKLGTPLNNLAALYEGQGALARAKALYLRSLAIYEKSLGKDHPHVAASLGNLAEVYKANGQYDKAQPLYERSLAILEKTTGGDHPDVALTLNNLGELHQYRGEYDLALPLFERSLAIVERALGAHHPYVATALSVLAKLHRDRGEYERALPLFRRSLAINKKAFGAKHQEVATSLAGLATLYDAQGAYEEALSLSKQSLAIYEGVLGDKHPHVAAMLNNVGRLYGKAAKYDQAIRFHKRGLKVFERLFGRSHPRLSVSLNNLATVYHAKGDHLRATRLLERSLEIQEKALGPDHPNVATTLSNLARAFSTQKDFSKALPLYKRSLKIRRDRLGKDHPKVSKTLNNLGSLYKDKGEFERAMEFYQQSLAIKEKTLGSEHPSVGTVLNNMAFIYGKQEDYERATALLSRSLKIKEASFGKEHPDIATILNNMAFFARARGKLRESLTFYKRSLAIRERAIGEEHHLTAAVITNLAVLHAQEGRQMESRQAIDRAFSIEQKHVSHNLRRGTAAEQKRIAKQFGFTRRLALSLALSPQSKKMPESIHELAARTVIEGKGLAGEAARSSSAQVRRQMALFEAIRSTQSQLSALAYKADTPAAKSQRLQERLDALQTEQARLGQRTEADTQATVSAVRRALTVPTALIDWIVYRPYDAARPRVKQAKVEQHLAAVVVRHHEPPRVFGLGPLSPVREAVQSFREHITQRHPKVDEIGRELYQKLLKPLTPSLQETETLIISPDGPLHSLPFAALVNTAGEYLAESYALRYLTTSRDLVHLSEPAFPARGPPVVLADAQFDSKPARSQVAQVDTRGSWSKDLARRMAPLPGTRAEAQLVSKLLEAQGSVLHMGPNATESTLRSVKGPRILHVATHGFFLPDSEGQAPMLRAGLALAGYNHRDQAPHDSDGLLTALDLSGLDLYGTELVVLSACETGLGQVAVGDGLYGLKRALFLAGSRSQVLSLWKVDDTATQALMGAFYDRLIQGDARAAALRNVQRLMLRGRLDVNSEDRTESRGATVAGSAEASPSTTKGWRHPYYWASFTLSGADGPFEWVGQ